MQGRPILITAVVISVLATAETVVALKYFRQAADADRVATMEKQLAEKTSEANRLIFLRDSERRGQRLTALLPASRYPATGLTSGEENELAEATFRATAGAGARQPVRDAVELELDELDSVRTAQGSSPMGPIGAGDIDPRHLVNMANIMTGKPMAFLAKVLGAEAIHYKNTRLTEDDPLWTVLDAIKEARALRSILLVGSTAADLVDRKRLKETLIQFGLPADLIQLRTGEPGLKNLDGIVIRLLSRGDS